MNLHPKYLFACVVAAAVWVPLPAGAQATPRFTGKFESEYLGVHQLDSSGTGCPATGGPPTDTPPGVFVSSLMLRATPIPVLLGVQSGKVVFTPVTSGYPESLGRYSPVDGQGSWTGTVKAQVGDEHLVGVCTTLIRLNPDGLTIDPDSVVAATFTSPTFWVSPVQYTPTTSTTTSTTVPRAVQVNPSFTG